MRTVVTVAAMGLGARSSSGGWRPKARCRLHRHLASGAPDSLVAVRSIPQQSFLGFVADVSYSSKIEPTIREVVDTSGGLDSLVNNVDIRGASVAVAEMSESEWDRIHPDLGYGIGSVWCARQLNLPRGNGHRNALGGSTAHR